MFDFHYRSLIKAKYIDYHDDFLKYGKTYWIDLYSLNRTNGILYATIYEINENKPLYLVFPVEKKFNVNFSKYDNSIPEYII